MLHVVCEIDVVPQHELFDSDGHVIARGDLWLRGTTTIHEYDGGDHLTVRQQRKDLARERRIGNETWLRRGYTQHDVLTQGIAILRDADRSLCVSTSPGGSEAGTVCWRGPVSLPVAGNAWWIACRREFG